MRRFAMLALTGAVLTGATPSTATTLWLSPFDAHVQGTTLTLHPAFDEGPAMDVRAVSVGGVAWVALPITLASDQQIQGVQLCYQSSSASSRIAQIRITRMTAPPGASVQSDAGVNLSATSPTCISSPTPSVTPAGTMTLSFRFEFANTTDVITLGAIGLDITPTSTAAPGAPESRTGGGLDLSPSHPNPLRASTAIDYTLPAGSDIDVAVFDVSGQRVRTLARRWEAAGPHRVVWDRRDDDGRRLSAGVYFYQVNAGSESGSRRMIVLP